ncbi:Ubiquitin carboxyl-terminal hydrolase 45 [Oryzias melastigma]|uniref:Ubiquitin carboxyl-terminal hydrolase 45 n=1 Tax=Oryzias melastigma TaxID=30732 RepID=A0A834FBK1_ORYME|nr:Ubiquitin carboxyl-terminal hydrolase 45 [Oryzias melastigma]
MAAAGSLSDGSERDSGAQDSSNDADSEASESEWAPRAFGHAQGHTSTSASAPASSSSPSSSLSLTRPCGAVEQMTAAVSKVNLGFNSGDVSASAHCCHEEQTQNRDNLQHHQGAFQALSHSYTPSSKECSIQSCLHQFTSVELLMGNNKLLCESCTERRQKQLRKSGSADKKVEKMYTSARKQMLISLLPPVIMLHLKRFHQAGMNLRKVNRHVDFPLILDLAPFCSASCKNLAAGERVLYSLYGIVGTQRFNALGATMLPMLKCGPPSGGQNSSTRTCQVRGMPAAAPRASGCTSAIPLCRQYLSPGYSTLRLTCSSTRKYCNVTNQKFLLCFHPPVINPLQLLSLERRRGGGMKRECFTA